ncbi:MAG: hypothetical protein NTY07_13975 [Bacteroidia bacterium]|nr:hypothetical protein [Bacteroidia bacterium]
MEKIKYHKTLATYFADKPLYLDEPTRKKPNTRKLVEQPWQQTNGEMWDNVIAFFKPRRVFQTPTGFTKPKNPSVYEVPDGV